MRCREARVRLNRLLDCGLPAESDAELTKHLAECPNCAEQARITGVLTESLKLAKADNDPELIPIEIMKQRVQAAYRQGYSKSVHRMTAPVYPMFRRWALAAIPALVTLVLVMTVVPISHYRITGWQVALEGVSLDLGENSDRVCEMLFDMGLVEAAVDVIGCDTTCSLLIFDLKTRTEAQLVASAFSSIDSLDVNTDVVPVRSTITRSLWQRVNEGILNP